MTIFPTPGKSGGENIFSNCVLTMNVACDTLFDSGNRLPAMRDSMPKDSLGLSVGSKVHSPCCHAGGQAFVFHSRSHWRSLRADHWRRNGGKVDNLLA